MTLYQRIFASKGKKEAQKAWFIAGLFEWPVMAFLGVLLGLLARVAFQQGMFELYGYTLSTSIDPELGLPILLKAVLPAGLMGLVLAAYFSAVMSTADSCLMACSGSFLTDLLRIKQNGDLMDKRSLRYSQFATFGLGALSLVIALLLENVLNAMLFSYAFMVSGLFVPIIGGLYWKRANSIGAFASMITGGAVTTILTLLDLNFFGFDPNTYGILSALVLFIFFGYLQKEEINYGNHI